MLSLPRAWVQSLVGELTPTKLRGAAKKKKKKKSVHRVPPKISSGTPVACEGPFEKD